MNSLLMDRKTRDLSPNEALSVADLQSLWRLESGALRMDCMQVGEPCDFVRLVLPGDLLGVESLVGVTDHLLVQAITPARLVPVVVLETGQLTQVLTDAVLRGHQRCRELVGLRTSTVMVRIKRLLQMLANGDGRDSGASMTCAIPSLRDMAVIVNAAPESVCRSLASLREQHLLHECGPRNSKHTRLQLREHRLQPGLLFNASI